jgi:hypothetical protein
MVVLEILLDLKWRGSVWYFKRKQKNLQAYGYRCGLHKGVFKSINFHGEREVY